MLRNFKEQWCLWWFKIHYFFYKNHFFRSRVLFIYSKPEKVEGWVKNHDSYQKIIFLLPMVSFFIKHQVDLTNGLTLCYMGFSYHYIPKKALQTTNFVPTFFNLLHCVIYKLQNFPKIITNVTKSEVTCTINNLTYLYLSVTCYTHHLIPFSTCYCYTQH